MAGFLVLSIILGCCAYFYLKSTLVKSFITIVVVICAAVAAFAYFESLTNVLLGRNIIKPLAHAAGFVILFVVSFAVLQIVAAKLIRSEIDLGPAAEKIGRLVCGFFAGLMLSGLLLTAIAMMPLSNRLPYQRFAPEKPDVENRKGTFLNADGFVTGWFNLISSGSLSGKRSFAAVHAGFGDHLFLNRYVKGVKTIAGSRDIEIPLKEALWPAPEDLTDAENQPLPSKSGCKLMFVRIGLKTREAFTLSQLRLVCQQTAGVGKKAKSVYPIGYMKTAGRLQMKELDEKIALEKADLKNNVRWIDFGFYVPDGYVPVLAAFKKNKIAGLPAPLQTEQRPLPEPFISSGECAFETAELEISGPPPRVCPVSLTAGSKFLSELRFKISDPNQWQTKQTNDSIWPAEFEDGRTGYVRSALEIEELAEQKKPFGKQSKTSKGKKGKARLRRTLPTPKQGIPAMLKVPEGYRLLSLRCQPPDSGEAVTAGQLPVLVEPSGVSHCPVGVIASGKAGEQTICEIDYCSVTSDERAEGLVFGRQGNNTKTFPDTVWITGKTDTVTEFYVLYLLKTNGGAVIESVRMSDSDTAAKFKEYEGFFID